MWLSHLAVGCAAATAKTLCVLTHLWPRPNFGSALPCANRSTAALASSKRRHCDCMLYISSHGNYHMLPHSSATDASRLIYRKPVVSHKPCELFMIDGGCNMVHMRRLPTWIVNGCRESTCQTVKHEIVSTLSPFVVVTHALHSRPVRASFVPIRSVICPSRIKTA